MAISSESTKVTTPSDREIRIERIFDAPRDLVWRAFTDPALIARWWGRGNRLDVERMEVERGGYWRYLEHAPDGDAGFEGRYREVTPPERIVRTFEWDGMPGYVSVGRAEFEELDDGRTKLVETTLFFTEAERDGMLEASVDEGISRSYTALDEVLASLR